MTIAAAKHALSILFAASIALFAATGASATEAPFSRTLKVRATAISANQVETVSTQSIAIKSEAAISRFAQITIPVNEHFLDLQITDAATVKPDGRRVPVDLSRILVSAYPNAPQMGLFEADVKVRTIVFPDVGVGDVVTFTTTAKSRNTPLRSGFQLAYVIDASSRFDDVEIALSSPETVTVRRALSGFTETVATANGRNLFTWIKDPQPYRAAEPNATAPIDREPHLIISTYASQEAFGKKFLEGADPKSAPTPEIRVLADAITRDTPDRKEQARAIYDWVTRNIRYFGVFLGDGGWVPHDANSILTAKYGDCKDHATLMRALLAAKGIDADYVLINTAPSYKTVDIPFPGYYNHVILYLPEFDLYADPTATFTAFQSLPESEADKPVLRIGAHGVAAVRTTALSADTNILKIKSDITLRADGTPLGVTTTTASGPIASSLRATVSQAALKGDDVFVKEQLTRQNWRGAGGMELRDSFSHEEPYSIRSSFELTNQFFGNGPNKYPIPLGPKLTSSDFSAPIQFIREKRTQSFFCDAGTYTQSISVHLPQGQSLARTPGNVDVSSQFGAYVATYALSGQDLLVERRLTIRVSGQVCDAEIVRELSPVLLAAAHDINTRLAFTNEGTESAEADQ